MKKICSLLVMLILLMQSSAYAAVSNAVQKAVDDLSGLGIMTGDETGDMMLEKQLTRAEFSVLVVRVLNMESVAETLTEQVTYFADVPSSHWASSYINLLYRLGIVDGTGDSTFTPDGNVTLQQAVKILVSVLGYDILAENAGGYPAGYLSVAAQKRMLDHLETESQSDLTRAEAAVLLYNSLDVVLLERTVGGDEKYVANGENTLRSVRENVLEVANKRGIVTANHATNLNGGEATRSGYIEIDGEQFHVGTTEAETYLGMEINYYYRYTQEDATPVLTSAVPTKYNASLVIDGSDILGADFSGRKLEYVERETDDEETVSLDESVKIIYNGKLLLSADDDDITPSYGSVELLDNNNDEMYDFIFVHEKESAIVDKLDTTNTRIILKDTMNNGLKSLEKKTDKDYLFRLVKDGEEIDLTQVQPSDVVTVEMSRDQKMMLIEVSNQPAVVGMVTQMDGNNLISIDGEDYVLADNPAILDRSALKVGREYRFYLDADGKIVYFDTETTKYNYGYLIGVNQESGIASDIQVKMVIDNQIEILSAKEKLRINNVSYMVTEAAQILSSAGKEERVFLVSRSTDGELRSLENPEIYGVSGSKRYNKKYNAFSSAYPFRFTEGTTVFMIPENPTQDEDYLTAADLEDNALINCVAFDVDAKTQIAKAIAVFGRFAYEEGGSIQKNAVVSIVDKVTQRLNEETQETENLISVYQFDEYLQLPVKENSAVSDIVRTLETGDLIKYSLNSLGRVDNIEIIAQDILHMKPGYSGISDMEEEMYGYIYSAKQNWLKQNSNVPADILYLSAKDDYLNTRSFVMETETESGKKSPIYCIDQSRNTIYPIEFFDIRSYEEVGTDADMAYVYSKNSAAQAVVVVKN